ncbi:MAG: two-component system, OmpR family, sensor histidine kinase KdpD [Chloroflexota bacterium]|nr:two-component system, OmpR family, sensor histidine kinase KdpD [Chloroflexota bacterium]
MGDPEGIMAQPNVAPATSQDAERARAAEHEALMGVLAHELRTPITTIYAGSAVLARDDDLLPAMRRELAADVYHEAARLFRAVEDLLVLTRLEHDAVRVTREPISLIRAVDAAIQIEGPRWSSMRVVAGLDGNPPPAAADPIALAHALRNLIANVGWRAGEAGDLEIVVGAHDTRVECRLFDRTGTLTSDDQRTLFALPDYEPLPGAISPGIAMYVAARLIQAMRGETWVVQRDAGTVEIGFSLPGYESAG